MGSHDRAWLLQQMLPPMLVGAAVLFLSTCLTLWLFWRLTAKSRPPVKTSFHTGKTRPNARDSGARQEAERRHLARIRELETELEKELNERIASQRGAIREVNQLKQTLNAYTEHIDSLRAERDQLATRLQAVQERSEADGTLRQECRQAQEQVAELTRALSDSESRNSRLGIELQLIRTIRTEFEALRKDNQHLEEELAAERQTLRDAQLSQEAKVVSLREENGRLRESLGAARARIAELEGNSEKGDERVRSRRESTGPEPECQTPTRLVTQGQAKVSPKFKFGDPPALSAPAGKMAPFSDSPRWEEEGKEESGDLFHASPKEVGGFAIPDKTDEPALVFVNEEDHRSETAEPNAESEMEVGPRRIPIESEDAPTSEEVGRVSEEEERANEEDAGIVRQDPELGLLYQSCPSHIDDLTKIKGVGRVLEGRLHELGVYRFKQIADWTDANVRAVAKRLSVRDRIARNRWREQCRELHEREHGNTAGGMSDSDRS